MIFSSNKVKSALGFFLAAGLLISCSESNSPKRKGANDSTFYVDALTAKFATVGEPNAQGKQNKKLISFEACLKDNAQTNSVADIPFDVVAGEAAASKVSDYRGCITWYELLEFEPDAEVKNVFMTRNLVAKHSHSGSEKLVFWVNPYKDTFEFNRNGSSGSTQEASGPVTYMLKDVRTNSIAGYDYDIYVKINEDANSLLSPIRRQAEITSLRLDYRSIDYLNIGVDSALNLTFPYTYKTSLAMDLIRQDLGNITSEKIKRGNFMFNLVFLKESNRVVEPKTSDVVAAVQWTAKPRGDAGLIEVPLTINFANVPALNSRMNVLLTITSLDKPVLFADQSYDGVINGISANTNLEIYLIPNESSARDLYTRYQAEKSVESSKKLVAKQVIESEGFSEIKNTNVKFKSKKTLFGAETESEVDLALVVENLKENGELKNLEAKAICTAFFEDRDPNDRLVKACMSSPNGVLNAEIRDFVVSVDSKPKNISFGRLESMKINADFSLTNDKIRSQGWGVEGKIGGNADASFDGMRDTCNTPYACGGGIDPTKSKLGQGRKTGLGLGASIGIGGKAYAGYDAVKMQKDSRGVSISSTEEVTSQPIAMSLDVTTRKCLLIVASAFSNKMTDVLPKSKYFCLKSTSSISYTEYFFFIDHKRVSDNSAVADIHSSVVNPLRMLVRGQKQYNFLRSILSSETGRFNIMLNVPDDKFTQDASSFMAQEAPLMLTTSRRPVLGPITK